MSWLWPKNESEKNDDAPVDWSKVSDDEIVDGLLRSERRPVMGRPSAGRAGRESAGPPEERYSPSATPSLRPGPQIPVRDAEVDRLRGRLAEINQSLEQFWENGRSTTDTGESLVSLVRERGEIDRAFGRWGIDIEDVDKEVAEEQMVRHGDGTTSEEVRGSSPCTDESDPSAAPEDNGMEGDPGGSAEGGDDFFDEGCPGGEVLGPGAFFD